MRKILTLAVRLVIVGGLAAGATACGSDASDASDATDASGVPTVVVTTNILGDVVSAAFGDLIAVEVVMPSGADPHEFAASAKQASAMEEADLLVVNGAGFEAGLGGVVDSVASGGTPVFAFADHVELLVANPDHHEPGHDEPGHDEPGAFDPHLWTDPLRIAEGLGALIDVIGELPGVDAGVAATRGGTYITQLMELDVELRDVLASVPAPRRVLVTNHEVFGYFADRYDFVVAGAVVPSLSTNAESSAKELELLAEALQAQSIRAIFAETTQSTQLAKALAAQVGRDVTIVELYTESLGAPGSGADTYLGMMRSNAHLVADALAGAA